MRGSRPNIKTWTIDTAGFEAGQRRRAMGKAKKKPEEASQPATAAAEAGPAGAYKGAKWTGTPAMTTEFGLLETGKIYPIPEERAKVSSGFVAVYGTENKEEK
jgi:hypothetical protein